MSTPGEVTLSFHPPVPPSPLAWREQETRLCLGDWPCSIWRFLTKESESGRGEKEDVICPCLKPRWRVWRGGPVLGGRS